MDIFPLTHGTNASLRILTDDSGGGGGGGGGSYGDGDESDTCAFLS